MKGWSEWDFDHASPKFLNTIIEMMNEEYEARREAFGEQEPSVELG